RAACSPRQGVPSRWSRRRPSTCPRAPRCLPRPLRQSRHQTVSGRAHQDGVVRFGLLSQPCEVLGAFQSPKAGPAVGSRVAIKRGDEVDEKLWHCGLLGTQVTFVRDEDQSWFVTREAMRSAELSDVFWEGRGRYV